MGDREEEEMWRRVLIQSIEDWEEQRLAQHQVRGGKIWYAASSIRWSWASFAGRKYNTIERSVIYNANLYLSKLPSLSLQVNIVNWKAA